jgi:hypothetical protein
LPVPGEWPVESAAFAINGQPHFAAHCTYERSSLLDDPMRGFCGHIVSGVVGHQTDLGGAVQGFAQRDIDFPLLTRCSLNAAISPLCDLILTGSTGAEDQMRAALAASNIA